MAAMKIRSAYHLLTNKQSPEKIRKGTLFKDSIATSKQICPKCAFPSVPKCDHIY